jgi:hypothetical protein
MQMLLQVSNLFAKLGGDQAAHGFIQEQETMTLLVRNLGHIFYEILVHINISYSITERVVLIDISVLFTNNFLLRCTRNSIRYTCM